MISEVLCDLNFGPFMFDGLGQRVLSCAHGAVREAEGLDLDFRATSQHLHPVISQFFKNAWSASRYWLVKNKASQSA